MVGIDGVQKALYEFSAESPKLSITKGSTTTDDDHSAFKKLSGDGIVLLRGDLFDINASMTGGRFDTIIDWASLVAIRPELREQYADVMEKLIVPGGTMLLVSFDRRKGTDEARKTGPLYSMDKEEVRRLYEGPDWVSSVEKLEELDELEANPGSVQRWKDQGIKSLFELCFLIRAK